MSTIPITSYLGDCTLYRTKLTAAQNGQPYVILCPTHQRAAAYAHCTQLLGCEPSFFVTCDKKSASWQGDEPAARIPLTNLSRYLKDIAPNNLVVYANQKAFRKIALQLAKPGIKHFYYEVPDWNIPKVKFNPSYYQDNQDKISRCLALLKDEESRRVFASIVKYRITGDHGYLRISAYEEYMHPLVNARGCTWVIDAGAANGLTSFNFARRAGRKCNVIAVEPDPRNLELIRTELPRHPTVILEPNAIGRDGERVLFKSGKAGSGSVVSAGSANHKEAIEIRCISLPTIYQKHQLSGRGLISFDVEGMEMLILQQDIAFIQQTRPKLQVSLYHRQDDLTDILLLLADKLPNYDFYMGHHTAKHTETDLYCLPREASHEKKQLVEKYFKLGRHVFNWRKHAA
jgi:FkbM family methyltransferase